MADKIIKDSTQFEALTRIRELREREGEFGRALSLDKFVDKLQYNTSKSTISDYENGNSSANVFVLLDIARTYNVSLDWLCGLSDIATSSKEVETINGYTGLSEKAILKLKEYKDNGGISKVNLISFLIEYASNDFTNEKQLTAKKSGREISKDKIDPFSAIREQDIFDYIGEYIKSDVNNKDFDSIDYILDKLELTDEEKRMIKENHNYTRTRSSKKSIKIRGELSAIIRRNILDKIKDELSYIYLHYNFNKKYYKKF